MRHCKKCLLPESVPGSNINADNVCEYCFAPKQSHLAPWDKNRAQFENDLEETIRNSKGKAEYDAVVCLSGGKDSLYLLYRLKVEYGLKILAFTTDINIPAIAWDNIKRTIAKLEIDHLVYRPSDAFYRKLFSYILRHQEQRGAVYSLSYVYAPLFEGDALQLATDKKIPLVFAGYSPGQPEPERMIYEFSKELIADTDWTPPHLKACGEFTEQELSRFWNPHRYPEGTIFPRYIAPFHAWNYNQEEVMKKVVELGLVKNSKHASPIFSNYPIQWLLMYSDLAHFGYNPYIPEFSALIREGKASLTYWKFMAPFVDFMIKNKIFMGQFVTKSMEWLTLKPDQLKITLPKGAYDPPVSVVNSHTSMVSTK
ncbi:MAG: hypothetical protein HYU69_00495 [Bacteroidetes bacterium]|nr:hypothetical protein [Bacteroidota bacterium]